MARARPPTASAVAAERLVTGVDRLVWWLIATAWIGVATSFWLWWLHHRAGATPGLYWSVALSLLYQTTVLPTFLLYFVHNMRRPLPARAPAHLRVAMITLCVPQEESIEVIRAQLAAMTRVSYPHDSWVLDEGGSPEVEAVAEACRVRYFTRKGVGRWNQPEAPFKRATKAGNVNAWLDHVAELGLVYDVFVQLDIDHQPAPEYLDRVLAYFDDAAVAWVQAPSVYGNLESWTARGLTEQDMIFHGPLQMGFFGTARTPMIVGSHTAYRMTAIREIGGFQPTRAEDHLDTVVLAAHGYRGVFVPEIIAVGAGPDDFGTYLRQQFAWAQSMTQILLTHMPRLLQRCSPRQSFQFLFCQTWYVLWSLSFAILWAAPTVALALHRPIASMPLRQFFVYYLPIPLMSTLIWCWSRRWFNPAGVLLSWRGALLETARWPVSLWAAISALLRIKSPYMITPKGGARTAVPHLARLYGPYVLLPLVPLAALWIYRLSGDEPLRGLYFWALFNILWGCALLGTVLLIELRRTVTYRAPRTTVLRARAAIVLTMAAVACASAATVVVSWQPILEAVR